MSCCSGNCGCGSGCKCGNGCGGCNMYPDISFGENTAAGALIIAVAAQGGHFGWSSELNFAAENGCKCGANCTCDPCTCK